MGRTGFIQTFPSTLLYWRTYVKNKAKTLTVLLLGRYWSIQENWFRWNKVIKEDDEIFELSYGEKPLRIRLDQAFGETNKALCNSKFIN